MLTARANHPLSEHYTISRDGQPLTEVNIRWWREAGEFFLDGQRCLVGRRGWMSGPFYLECAGRLLASAVKPSALLRRFELDVAGERFVLAARSPFFRAFELEQDGRVVGTISPVSVFTRTAGIELPDALPLPVQVFVAWLVLVLWRRQRNSAH